MAFKMKAGKEGPMKKNFPGMMEDSPNKILGKDRTKTKTKDRLTKTVEIKDGKRKVTKTYAGGGKKVKGGGKITKTSPSGEVKQTTRKSQVKRGVKGAIKGAALVGTGAGLANVGAGILSSSLATKGTLGLAAAAAREKRKKAKK
tara:strand:- start:1191 stop:1625 length:435 start_codon:yes stop_codon:yes gene_type:complete